MSRPRIPVVFAPAMALALALALGGCSTEWVIPVTIGDQTTVNGELVVINATGAPFDLVRIDPCTHEVDDSGAKAVPADGAVAVAFSLNTFTMTPSDVTTAPATPSFSTNPTDYVTADGPKTVLTIGEDEDEMEVGWSTVAAALFERWRVDASGGARPGRPTYAVTIDEVVDLGLTRAIVVDSCAKAAELDIVALIPEC